MVQFRPEWLQAVRRQQTFLKDLGEFQLQMIARGSRFDVPQGQLPRGGGGLGLIFFFRHEVQPEIWVSIKKVELCCFTCLDAISIETPKKQNAQKNCPNFQNWTSLDKLEMRKKNAKNGLKFIENGWSAGTWE